VFYLAFNVFMLYRCLQIRIWWWWWR